MKIALISLFSFISFMQKSYSCGQYNVSAAVIMKEGYPSLVINPGSKSEINLTVEFAQTSKLAPYIGRSINTLVQIDKEMDNTIGVINKIGEIKVIPPDPLAPHLGTSFNLIEKSRCKE
jgi:hypothetical protein